MLRNYKFIIAYDGTRFFGWEPDAPTPESMPGPWRPTPSWTWTCPRRRSGTI